MSNTENGRESSFLAFGRRSYINEGAGPGCSGLDIVKIFLMHQVKESLKLRRVMQTILSLGNALNSGTARGMRRHLDCSLSIMTRLPLCYFVFILFHIQA